MKELNDFISLNGLLIYDSIFNYYNIFTLEDLRILLIKYPNIFKNNKKKQLNMSQKHINIILNKLQLNNNNKNNDNNNNDYLYQDESKEGY